MSGNKRNTGRRALPSAGKTGNESETESKHRTLSTLPWNGSNVPPALAATDEGL